ncbi:hypothetical protein ABWU93_14370 [Xanthomonas translucens pv. translucens]|uniref:hypothetical protein n=1 Tax=Xanthomonas campestris pv. translucens TaxID=343 RepID=UPI003F714545
MEELDLRGCNNLGTLPQSINQLPGNCTIKVPQHLEHQLNALRTQAARAARVTAQYAASSSTGAAGPSQPQAVAPETASNEASMQRIEKLAYDALEMIMDNGNPFMPDNPPIDPPSGSNGRRMQLGESSAVAKMIKESNNPELRSIIKKSMERSWKKTNPRATKKMTR